MAFQSGIVVSNKCGFLKALVFLILLFFYCTGNSVLNPKVLIIGIDGCRPDALQAANTPNLTSILDNCAFSFKAQTDSLTVSGPAWSAMLTGVWHGKHGVLNNDYENPNNNEFPHFFSRVKENFPDALTASVVTWGPIHKILKSGECNLMETYSTDDSTASAAAKIISEQDPIAVFVQLDEVDGAGHENGYSSGSDKYLKAIELRDKNIGTMINAVKSRETYLKEDWLIIITTDHGGLDTGHGGVSPEELTIFFLVYGKNIKKGEIRKPVNVVDTAVTALKHLGVPIQPDWDLDGKPAGIK